MQNPCNCFVKAKSLNVLRDLNLSVAFFSKFNTSGLFKKFQGFFSEHPIFLAKNPISESFEKSDISVAVDTKLAKFSCFQKFKFLFRKKHLFLEPKMSRNPTDSFDSAAKLLPLSFQQKFKIVSREPHLFLRKTNFERFEKPYCFSCIQQRKWYF